MHRRSDVSLFIRGRNKQQHRERTVENFEIELCKLEKMYLSLSVDLTDCKIELSNMDKPYWKNEAAVSKQSEIKAINAKMKTLSCKMDTL